MIGSQKPTFYTPGEIDGEVLQATTQSNIFLCGYHLVL